MTEVEFARLQREVEEARERACAAGDAAQAAEDEFMALWNRYDAERRRRDPHWYLNEVRR